MRREVDYDDDSANKTLDLPRQGFAFSYHTLSGQSNVPLLLTMKRRKAGFNNSSTTWERGLRILLTNNQALGHPTARQHFAPPPVPRFKTALGSRCSTDQRRAFHFVRQFRFVSFSPFEWPISGLRHIRVSGSRLQGAFHLRSTWKSNLRNRASAGRLLLCRHWTQTHHCIQLQPEPPSPVASKPQPLSRCRRLIHPIEAQPRLLYLLSSAPLPKYLLLRHLFQLVSVHLSLFQRSVCQASQVSVC
ncbi:hypothetical protein QBC32DRAFT_139597 [Pseudoneurospora amorphoporcata]|uniref:Uncharacterized protein n=1 Tax=Pseudoneurospora amorphoporcata TaxID=241081 RepID=A0AAN6NUY4_9PEZI|nr:hypothetical protein QBC32DRAFT_139597 [Pseudoneurospora amorphoporcata]